MSDTGGGQLTQCGAIIGALNLTPPKIDPTNSIQQQQQQLQQQQQQQPPQSQPQFRPQHASSLNMLSTALQIHGLDSGFCDPSTNLFSQLPAPSPAPPPPLSIVSTQAQAPAVPPLSQLLTPFPQSLALSSLDALLSGGSAIPTPAPASSATFADPTKVSLELPLVQHSSLQLPASQQLLQALSMLPIHQQFTSPLAISADGLSPQSSNILTNVNDASLTAPQAGSNFFQQSDTFPPSLAHLSTSPSNTTTSVTQTSATASSTPAIANPPASIPSGFTDNTKRHKRALTTLSQSSHQLQAPFDTPQPQNNQQIRIQSQTNRKPAENHQRRPSLLREQLDPSPLTFPQQQQFQLAQTHHPQQQHQQQQQNLKPSEPVELDSLEQLLRNIPMQPASSAPMLSPSSSFCAVGSTFNIHQQPPTVTLPSSLSNNIDNSILVANNLFGNMPSLGLTIDTSSDTASPGNLHLHQSLSGTLSPSGAFGQMVLNDYQPSLLSHRMSNEDLGSNFKAAAAALNDKNLLSSVRRTRQQHIIRSRLSSPFLGQAARLGKPQQQLQQQQHQQQFQQQQQLLQPMQLQSQHQPLLRQRAQTLFDENLLLATTAAAAQHAGNTSVPFSPVTPVGIALGTTASVPALDSTVPMFSMSLNVLGLTDRTTAISPSTTPSDSTMAVNKRRRKSVPFESEVFGSTTAPNPTSSFRVGSTTRSPQISPSIRAQRGSKSGKPAGLDASSVQSPRQPMRARAQTQSQIAADQPVTSASKSNAATGSQPGVARSIMIKTRLPQVSDLSDPSKFDHTILGDTVFDTPGQRRNSQAPATPDPLSSPLSTQSLISGALKRQLLTQPSTPDTLSESNALPGVVKMYKCIYPGCEVKFQRVYDIKRHQLCHASIREHVCEVCGIPFSRSDALLRHRRHKSHGWPPADAPPDTSTQQQTQTQQQAPAQAQLQADQQHTQEQMSNSAPTPAPAPVPVPLPQQQQTQSQENQNTIQSLPIIDIMSLFQPSPHQQQQSPPQ